MIIEPEFAMNRIAGQVVVTLISEGFINMGREFFLFTFLEIIKQTLLYPLTHCVKMCYKEGGKET
jgi:hypothetical protein